MTRRKWILVSIIVVVLILVLYVTVAKPTLFLPTVTIVLPEASPLIAVKHQLNSDELQLRLRTDGKAFFVSDGKELGQIAYTPATLGNAVRLAQKALLPPSYSTLLRVVPLVFPDLMIQAWLFASTVYHVLPLEITFRFISG